MKNKVKRTLASIIMAVMMITSCCIENVVVYAETAETQTVSTDGDEIADSEETIESSEDGETITLEKEDGTTEVWNKVSNISDLDKIRYNPSLNYILTEDIDLTEATQTGGEYDKGNGWEPIEKFTGNFDGNGYCIIGLNMYGSSRFGDNGLFATIGSDSTVKNVAMIDVNINGVSGDAGAICGELNGNISGCYVTGVINSKIYAGGIAGTSYGTIENCFNLADISSNGGYSAGGIVGRIASTYAYVKNCYNKGNAKYGIGATYPYSYSYFNTFYLKQSGVSNQGWDYSSDKTGQCQGISEQEMQTGNFFGNLTDIWETDPFCESIYPYPQLKNNRYVRVLDLSMTKTPKKLVYQQGDEFSIAGSEFEITYDTKNVSDMEDTYTVSVAGSQLKKFITSCDMNEIGAQNVVVNLGGKKVNIPITIKAIPAEEIVLESDEVSINKSKKIQLTATVLPETATDKSLVWESDNEEIATVDEDGQVTGKKNGTATITVKSAANSECMAQCKVTVKTPCTYLLLSEKELVLQKGATHQLTQTMTPLDATDTISWESSDSEVATVEDGLITACKSGETTITAVTESGKTASCSVVVKQNIDTFVIQGLFETNYTGEEITQDIIVTDGYSILQENVDYTVSYSNNVAPGTATIIVTGMGYYEGEIVGNWVIKGTQNNVTNQGTNSNTDPSNNQGTNTNTDPNNNQGDNANTNQATQSSNNQTPVTNTSQTSTVVISQKTAKIAVEKTVQLSLFGASGTIKWSSKNKSIATVSSKGLVKGKQMGTTTITAKYGGKTYTCKVTVGSNLQEDVWYAEDYNSYIEIVSISGNKMKFNINMSNMKVKNKTATVQKNGKTATCKLKCDNKKWHNLTFSMSGGKLKVTEKSSCAKKIILLAKSNKKKKVSRSFR